jgi:hypothetical protein
MPTASLVASVVNLDGPGTYLHWSIFEVSVANLILIGVMVVIFGAALLLRFPSHADGTRPPPATADVGAPADSAESVGDPEDAAMWTARLRRTALRLLPPGKLLPDRQPAYVASWVYVFGVAALATFGLVVISGFAIAIGGTDWWHTTAVGHFFNSLHLWGVEAFMAFMVIHLWGKFWMAAWRGRRAFTWITGVVAFLVSVVECFTGYLSQQNFDSQWISTNGKDAINATGLGSFFNLMNFGQMLLWHVVLVPILLVALIGAHILAVRVRGVSHPLPVRRARGAAARRDAALADGADWRGPTRRYDIIKEASIATLVALVLVVALAGLLSSPDEPPLTVASWAKVAPADFIATAASELAGTSETGQYGPPYNSGSSNVQSLLFSPQKLGGVRDPINTAEAFVLQPLARTAATVPALGPALAAYNGASTKTQAAWNAAYAKAVAKVTFHNGSAIVPAAADGPIPVLLATELRLARNGALDADLLANHAFYGTNFTLPLLFLEDGQYFSGVAQAQHLTGSQWGVMNETGSYPGQPWLWIYTLWYQVPGFDHSANVDLIAIYLTAAASIILLATPFIPGLRDLPRLLPVHRLIWRNWYRSQAPDEPGAPARAGPPIDVTAASGAPPPPVGGSAPEEVQA